MSEQDFTFLVEMIADDFDRYLNQAAMALVRVLVGVKRPHLGFEDIDWR